MKFTTVLQSTSENHLPIARNYKACLTLIAKENANVLTLPMVNLNANRLKSKQSFHT